MTSRLTSLSLVPTVGLHGLVLLNPFADLPAQPRAGQGEADHDHSTLRPAKRSLIKDSAPSTGLENGTFGPSAPVGKTVEDYSDILTDEDPAGLQLKLANLKVRLLSDRFMQRVDIPASCAPKHDLASCTPTTYEEPCDQRLRRRLRDRIPYRRHRPVRPLPRPSRRPARQPRLARRQCQGALRPRHPTASRRRERTARPQRGCGSTPKMRRTTGLMSSTANHRSRVSWE